MKTILLILSIVSLAGINGIQQNDVKVYAFRQAQSQGVRPAAADSSGNISIQKKGQKNTYLIFVELPAGGKTGIEELWIDGERYSFKKVKQQTPVRLNTGLSMLGQQDDILVPATKNEVYRILPAGKQDTTTKAKRKAAGIDTVVVYYSRNGKKHREASAGIRQVPDLVNQ